MALYPLIPQIFDTNQATQLPAIDFFQFSKAQLPSVYQNAPNFMATVQAISSQKQKIYDTIRSLVNVYNLNSKAGGSVSAAPTGVYLQMLASVFNTAYDPNDSDEIILFKIRNSVIFANSRGLTSDFYQYFINNNLDGEFNNFTVEEDGNATIFFDVPIANDPSLHPNPFEVFSSNMKRIKGAGIKIIVNTANIPFFQFGGLDSFGNSTNLTAPGNAGFGILTSTGDVINGGFFKSL